MNPFGEEDDDDIDDQYQQDINEDGLDENGQPIIDDSQQQQQQPAAPSFKPEDIAALVAATMQANREPQAPKQMTAEEAAEHFQVFNPDDSFVNGLNKLADPEATPAERRAIVNQLRDGLVNQSFRAAELLLDQRLAQLDSRYAPVLAIAQKQEAAQLEKAFVGKYPALKGQTDLINSITAGLTAQGFKPKSPDEAFDKVAGIAESILKKVNPEFKLGTPKSGGGGRSPSMAGTNMGGHGGGFQTQGERSNGQPPKRGAIAPFFLNKK